MSYFNLLNICFLLLSLNGLTFSKTCVPRWFNKNHSFVCVCNITYCDSFDELHKKTVSTIITKFESDKLEQRFVKSEHRFTIDNFHEIENYDGQTIIIDRNQTFQTILGFGAAFTDATGINIEKLGPHLGKNVIRDYFDKKGLRYSMARVPMGGTDFSIKPYSYDDTERDDFDLIHFKLTKEDFKYKIPWIKFAQNISEYQIKLFCSPWSPPAWMKTNGRINGNGTIKGKPDGIYYRTWADYFIKFIQEYKKQGIDFWGMTIQNEPFDGTLHNFPFNCNAMSPEEQRDFIFKILGPKLNSAGFGIDVLKLMIVDDQRPFIKNWAKVILSQKQAKKYISGIAFHWYLNMITSPEVLEEVHKQYPEYFLLSSEACEGSSPLQGEKVSLGNWQRAENYAYDIIMDLLYHTNGWTDWNMVLDMQGGPNWAGNFVDAPIIINNEGTEYYKQPMYYALAHFTRFLEPGSIRIGLKTNKEYLNTVAFRTPKNSTVLIIINRYESIVPLKIIDPKYGAFVEDIKGHSLQTLIWFD